MQPVGKSSLISIVNTTPLGRQRSCDVIESQVSCKGPGSWQAPTLDDAPLLSQAARMRSQPPANTNNTTEATATFPKGRVRHHTQRVRHSNGHMLFLPSPQDVNWQRKLNRGVLTLRTGQLQAYTQPSMHIGSSDGV